MEWVNLAVSLVGVAIAAVTLHVVLKQEAGKRRVGWSVTPTVTIDRGMDAERRVLQVSWSRDGYVLDWRLVGAEATDEWIAEMEITGITSGAITTGSKQRVVATSTDWSIAYMVVTDLIPESGRTVRVTWQPVDPQSALELGSAPKMRWHRAGVTLVRIPQLAATGPGLAQVAAITPREWRAGGLDRALPPELRDQGASRN